MKIALASPRIATSIDDGLNKINRLMKEAAAQDAEIACFPEAYLPGLRGQDFEVLSFDRSTQEHVLNLVSQLARTNKIAAILGIGELLHAENCGDLISLR